jgi:hypothetical protein
VLASEISGALHERRRAVEVLPGGFSAWSLLEAVVQAGARQSCGSLDATVGNCLAGHRDRVTSAARDDAQSRKDCIHHVDKVLAIYKGDAIASWAHWRGGLPSNSQRVDLTCSICLKLAEFEEMESIRR